MDDKVPDGVNIESQYGSHPSYSIIFTFPLKFTPVISKSGISFGYTTSPKCNVIYRSKPSGRSNGVAERPNTYFVCDNHNAFKLHSL